MPSQISDHQYGQAILESARSGSYPESEEVIASQLPPSALGTVIQLIDHAREDVKKAIRKISRECAPDIDGWVSQARQLRADIEHSQKSSQEILDQDRYGRQLQTQADDANQKLSLLNGEVFFTEVLTQLLEKICSIRQVLAVTEEAVLDDRFEEAVDLLCKADDKLIALQECQNARVAGLLQNDVSAVRRGLVEKLAGCWESAFCIDISNSAIHIKSHVQRSFLVDIDIVVDALSRLNLLEEYIMGFYQQLDTLILSPRLKFGIGRTLCSLHVEESEIKTNGKLIDFSIQKLFKDMNLVVDFLHAQLSSSVTSPLAKQLIPRLTSLLISDWLSLELPTNIREFSNFETVLTTVAQFANVLESYGWGGKDRLLEWGNQIPHVWLTKRKETSLDEIRKLLARGLGKSERVERIETQMLSREDDVFKAKNGDDEWNASWSDDEGGDTGKMPKPSDVKMSLGADAKASEEDEDVSAWGLDDENTDDTSKKTPTISDSGNDDADAWGWGDENEDSEAPQLAEGSYSDRAIAATNGRHEGPDRSIREVTLKEYYNITALPKPILEVITHLVSDAEALRSPSYTGSPIVSAAGGLLSLPGLVLSIYRASAPIYYSMNPSGNMFLYNDSLWLAESLRHFTGAQSKRTGQINVSAAETEISALESFAKRTYGKEMESQRTIIGDLLDGAQGFANCTEPPFAQECDIAISSTTDRLRELHDQWKEVLSHSALLQSLGSLLSTVVMKIIVDVEDMGNISEPESQRLTAFCNRIASLEDLFTQKSTGGASEAQNVPLTAVYTPNWLKFQYLANILESSLVDIKYLWLEGELKLEFEAEELVDLIEALFADSEHRRKAIGEIRRASVGR